MGSNCCRILGKESLINFKSSFSSSSLECKQHRNFHTHASGWKQKADEKVVKPISLLMVNDIYEINADNDGLGGFIGLNKLLNKLKREELDKGL